MKIRFLLFILMTLHAAGEAFCQKSQGWVEMMKDPSVNFYEVQKEFNKSLKKYERKMKRKVTPKGAEELEKEMPGFMQYKRWEWFTEPRVYPSGNRGLISKGMADQWSQNKKSSNPVVMQTGNWSLLGPMSAIPTGGGGAGRVNCLAIHPSNPSLLFAGTPAGGLWRSADGGITWSTNTDHLANLGISDIAIDPVNPNNMYIATGDGDGSDNYSIGILKSTDGGSTWNVTGFSYVPDQARQVSRLLIDPVNPNILFAATNMGIYRSLDAGATWVRTFSTGGIKDMEFRPGNSQVLYASGNGFYRSMDGGSNFSGIASVAPTGASRVSIAVSAADSNYVYALAGNPTDQGLLAVYRSTNGGYSFTGQTSSTPNILGWAWDGSDVGGQAWYDLAFAASPTDRDEIYVGGVNIWSSSDGGVNWTIKGHWTGSGAAYVHADVHTLVYQGGNSLYAGCDGGIFHTTDDGSTWTDLSNGLQIAQMYRLGTAATDPGVVIQGWQDNGTGMWDSGVWSRIYGGDGMECFIDRTDANTMYCELYYGDFQRSTDGGVSFNGIKSNISETGAWVTPWCQDPQNPQTLYAGFKNVWKSTDQGNSWSQISTTFTGGLQSLAVAPSNPNYIYAGAPGLIQRTTNGGTTWTNIKAGLPAGSLSYIAVSGNDPDRAWVTYASYTAAYKVYKTVNGGATWTKITYDLPNVPVNCIVVDTSSAVEGIYVGTDLGVYYTDSTRTNWTYFSNGLPNVIVNELEIQYSSGKLRAATYGRGLWETNLFNPNSTAPLANFKGNILTGCPGHTVQFTDMSTNNPTGWNWTFPGGVPSSSTLQNPSVTYTVAGSYNDVSLVASNAGGNDAITKYSYIGISTSVKPITYPAGSVTVCAAYQWIDPSVGLSYKWIPTGSIGPQLKVTVSGTYQVIVTDIFGCADTSLPFTVTLQPAIPTPTITVNGSTLSCIPSSGYTFQWYLNGNPVSGATQYTVTGTSGGSYFVVITNGSGCTKQSAALLSDVMETDLSGVQIAVSPSPNNGSFVLDVTVDEPATISLAILDATGRMIHEKDLGRISGRIRENFSLPLSHGIYFINLKTEAGNVVRKFVVE